MFGICSDLPAGGAVAIKFQRMVNNIKIILLGDLFFLLLQLVADCNLIYSMTL